jgi:transcriptional antiterminator NusG
MAPDETDDRPDLPADGGSADAAPLAEAMTDAVEFAESTPPAMLMDAAAPSEPTSEPGEEADVGYIDERTAEDGKPKPKRRRSRAKKEEESVGPKVDESKLNWFALKVQSNREDSIADAIRRRLKIHGLDMHVADVVVPTEKVLEIKDGRKRVVKRKFYPGYIMLRMEMTDDVWFTIRDTPGVGHFVGGGAIGDKPLPMNAADVERMMGRTQATVVGEEETKEAPPRPAIDFAKGDRVVIKEGPFENFEGDVEDINEDKGKIRVVIQIFGRPTPVDVDYWQVGKVRL